MKKIIALILTICICVSCVTPSQTFLATKHNVEDYKINMLQEVKVSNSYSPYFELLELVEFTNKGINSENYDSIQLVYKNLREKNYVKSNCIAYDVQYKLNNDTIHQRVFFINKRHLEVTHDNDVIRKMHFLIKRNLYRFQNLHDEQLMSISHENDSTTI
jgi:hypothetical protein